jgi:hypothetical protein
MRIPSGFYKLHTMAMLTKVTAMILMAIMCLSCSSQEVQNLPEQAQALDNLTIYSADAEPAWKIQLLREQVFGNTDKVLVGQLGSMAIDESGRVFITDFNQYSIHVFEPDGRYVTRLGEEGSGPGEFLFGPTLKFISNHLYAYDQRQLKVNVFSPVSLTLSHTLNLNPKNMNRLEGLSGFSSFPWILFRSDGTFLTCFNQPLYSDPEQPGYNLEVERYMKCYFMDVEGRIKDDKILEVRDTRFLAGSVKKGDFSIGVFRHFAARPLLTLSEDDQIYSAWSEDFLIKVYDREGNYLRAWYYPYQKVKLTKENALQKAQSVYGRDIITRNLGALPETWPALNDLLVDDENHLWVSTIVEDFDVYEWWVLEETGELITKFEWPRDEPIEVVKNGYMYTRQTDEETGLQQIVRYRIELEEL